MFDLEKEIREWKKGFGKFESFEDGLIADMELHLRDAYEAMKAEDLGNDAAFAKAVAQVGTAADIAEEYRKNRELALDRRAPWRPARFMPALLANSAKVAWRKLRRHKSFTIITIAGLALGMAACLLILLFVRDELSYDRTNHDADRIFRVAVHMRFGGTEGDDGTVPEPLAASCLQEFPEVEQTVRLSKQGDFIVRHGDRSYTESRLIFADTSIFQVFTLPLRRGDPRSALAGPRMIALSETAAQKYFGSANPVGQTLRLDNSEDYLVSGVFRDMPANSHFHFDLIASLESLTGSRQPRWENSNFFTYLLLRPGSDPAALQAKFPSFTRKYMGPWVKEVTGRSIDELFASGARVEYFLQPLPDIHLHSRLRTEIELNGDIGIVYIFSVIALLILVIAAINFINLSTARSAGRSKEVGIRKVLGSERQQLVRQFLFDSLLSSGLAVILAVLLTAAALPWFNHLTEKAISLSGTGTGFVAAAAALMTLLVGLLAGAYPAWRLAATRPIEALKGKLAVGVSGGRQRSVLVVIQFVISMVLIIATLVVFRQLQFIRSKNLGFNKDQVLVLQNAFLLGTQTVAFKNEMMKHPAVVSGSVSGFIPLPPSASNSKSIFPKGKEIISSNTVLAQNWSVDGDYIKTMGMKIVAGRDFAKDAPADYSAVIINQAAASRFGWQDPLGRQISFPRADDSDLKTFIDRTVIGVVEDFHFESLHSPIGPLVMFLGKGGSRISFRIRARKTFPVLAELKRQWQHFAPGQPFEYAFMDESFAKLYRSEQQLGEIFSVFSGLAILIACLGLLALTSFMAKRRTKEIGIRKVLGATVLEIFLLLCREFLKWVALAAVIAWPLSVYVMNRWLQGFAYRTEIGFDLLLLSIMLTSLITMLTVSFQVMRAARANPVDSLRYE